jgi:YgiT-type zinc finger domain-containing protein
MKCHVCGSVLNPILTDLPFKLSPRTIVVVRDLPVLQCGNCTDYLLEDEVMASVEAILDSVADTAELEIVKYAA